MEYNEIYTKPVSASLITDFQNWGLNLDSAKSINENLAEIADSIARQSLELRMHIEAHEHEKGLIAVSSEAFDEAFFFFDLTAAMKGAVHSIVTNYAPRFRAEHADETKADLLALRDRLQEAVDVVTEAIESPDSYAQNRTVMSCFSPPRSQNIIARMAASSE